MPVPVDPYPNFVPGALADGDQVDARFLQLYRTLDPSVVGIDSTNIKDGGVVTADLADLAVTTAKLAANAVTAAKIEAQQAWQTVAWSAGFPGNLTYMKDSLGFVHIRGDEHTTTGITAAAGLVTMPANFRPGSTQTFHAMRCEAAGNTPLPITITAAGVLVFKTTVGAGPVFSFGSVYYRAEN